MIRWLSTEEWKDFIENQALMGKYVSHELHNKGNVTHPIDEYHFSDATVKVKIIEPGYKKPKSVYFNNTGIIKVQGDKYDEFSDCAEYTFYWCHPQLVSENFEFILMMIKKFGLAYLKKRAIHCENELYECITDKDIHKSDADEASMLLGHIRTNISSIISPELLNLKSKNKDDEKTIQALIETDKESIQAIVSLSQLPSHNKQQCKQYELKQLIKCPRYAQTHSTAC